LTAFIRYIRKLTKRLVDVFGVGCVLAGVSSTPDPRTPLQGINEQSGVIGNGGPSCGGAERASLQERVALEGRLRLLDVGHVVRTREELDAEGCEDFAHLFRFMRVSGREDEEGH
jgi:hypothetical protein